MKKTTQQPVYKIKLAKGDLVVVRTGRLKGQKGRVLQTHPKTNQVTVENLNLVKKHYKPNKEHPQGAIAEVNKPLLVSKVALLEPKSNKATKISYKISKDGQKVRIYKKTGQPVVKSSRRVVKTAAGQEGAKK